MRCCCSYKNGLWHILPYQVNSLWYTYSYQPGELTIGITGTLIPLTLPWKPVYLQEAE